jgi:hypothetical protein
MTVSQAIQRANSILPGLPSREDPRNSRWQAIIKVGKFVRIEPEALWEFVERWGKHPSEDLRMAIATCLLEHLLQYHFNLLFPRVERLARKSKRFAETLCWCGKFGQAGEARNSARLDRLLKERGVLIWHHFSARASRR